MDECRRIARRYLKTYLDVNPTVTTLPGRSRTDPKTTPPFLFDPYYILWGCHLAKISIVDIANREHGIPVSDDLRAHGRAEKARPAH